MTYIGIRDMEEKLYTMDVRRYTTVVRTSARGFFWTGWFKFRKTRGRAGFPKQLLFSDFPFVARRCTRWL